MIINATPDGILRVFFRHWRKFVLVFVLCVGAATGYCLVATPKYQSEARLLVRFGREDPSRNDMLPSPAIAAQQTERKEVVNSEVLLLQSRDLVDDVLHTLKIDRLYPNIATSTPADEVDDAAAREFLRDLDPEAEKDSNVITVTLLNRDPELAAKALGMLIEKFSAKQSRVYQSGELKFMEGQLEQARANLNHSRAAVANFKSAAGISSLEEERTYLLRERADASGNLSQQASKEQEAEGRFTRLEAALKNVPTNVPLTDENDRFKAVDDARQKLEDLRSHENELLVTYRPDSVPVVNVRDQIASAENELSHMSKQSAARVRTGANPVHQDIQTEMLKAAGDESGAAGARQAYDAEIKRIDQRLGDLSAKESQLNSLQLQQQVDEENFRNTLQAVDDARMTDNLNRDHITSVAVVQTPIIPVKPARPKVLLILAASVVLGLVGGIAATMLSEMMDQSFTTADQIETVLGIPVITALPLARRAAARRTRST